MKTKWDMTLITIFLSVNLFMVGIQETSLITLLPKIFSNSTYNYNNQSNKLLNDSFSRSGYLLNITQKNASNNCDLKSEAPYIVVSMIYLARSLMQNISNPLVGILSGVVNSYTLCIMGQLLAILVLIIYSSANLLTNFIIGRVLDAFSISATFIMVFSIKATLVTSSKNRSRIVGIGNFLFFMSLSLGPIYGAKIDSLLDTKSVFLFLIIGWIVCLILTLMLWKRNFYFDTFKQQKVEMERNDTQCKLVDDKLESNINDVDNVNNVIEIIENDNDEINYEPKKSDKHKNVKLWLIMKDPYVLCLLFDLFIVDLFQFMIPVTLPIYMKFNLCSTVEQQGYVWSFSFAGYGIGIVTVLLVTHFLPKSSLVLALIAKLLMSITYILLPYITNWKWFFLPIILAFVGLGIVEQVLFPLSAQLTDIRHEGRYGHMNSMISNCFGVCAVVGNFTSGPIIAAMGFKGICFMMSTITFLVAPLTLVHMRYLNKSEKS